VAAKANGLDVEVVFTTPNKTPEYLAINPLGKIPSFVGANGFQLTEAIAIAIYSTYHIFSVITIISPRNMMYYCYPWQKESSLQILEDLIC
jgi:Glutathione S-transferase, N-terminal domain